MKKPLPLQQYLDAAGVNSQTPPDQIQQLKKEYKKLYRKWSYYKREKVNTKRVNLTFSKKQYARLQKMAGGESLASFIKKAALTQTNLTPPSYTSEVNRLVKEINAIGHNINQVVWSLHALKNYENEQQYRTLSEHVGKVQDLIEAFFLSQTKSK